MEKEENDDFDGLRRIHLFMFLYLLRICYYIELKILKLKLLIKLNIRLVFLSFLLNYFYYEYVMYKYIEVRITNYINNTTYRYIRVSLFFLSYYKHSFSRVILLIICYKNTLKVE